MVWLRRIPASVMLVAFVLTDLVIDVLTHTAGASLNRGQSGLWTQQVIWLAADVFLARKTWLGRSWAWAIMLVLSVFFLAVLLVGAAAASGYALTLFMLILAQALILLTPSVRSRAFRREPGT